MNLLGRLLFGGFFLSSGMNHFQSLDAMTGYAASKGVPQPREAVMLSGAMLLGGGASVALGMRPEIGALVLSGFLIPTSVMMHDFWNEEDPVQKQNQMVHFMKNMALLGSCFMIASRVVPKLRRAAWSLADRNLAPKREVEERPPAQIPLEVTAPVEEMMRY